MTSIGTIELTAGIDVRAGEKTTIPTLFPLSERSKEYELQADVVEGRKLTVALSKLDPFDTTLDATLKKGQSVSCWRLIRYADFNERDLVAAEDIRKGDKLTVDFGIA